MGKLKITGKAKHEYSFDRVEMTIRFQIHERSSSRALQKVMDQCESFLEMLSEKGIHLQNVRLGDNDVDQSYYDEKLRVTATRELVIRLPFDMSVTNYILELVAEKEFDVDVDTEYSLSKYKEIHDQLILEAIEDSKRKAQTIAENIGNKVIGIESMELEKTRFSGSMDWMCQEQERSITGSSRYSHSNRIESPITEESEEVEVVWLISDENKEGHE